MVKLSLPSWDKDKSQFQAGTSFTPTLTSRSRASAPSSPSVFRRLRSPDSTASQTQAANIHPLMVLRLSSPSFLDSVVHDGSSDNPLYVIDTVDNVTKVRRSDPKGFVNISRVRWPMDPQKSMSRKNKDLTGVEVAFGKGSWRPADEFMGYSYSSLSSYRKFYIPHHKHSLKWKPSGAQYACTTETVRGPVAILEPAMQRAPPKLKILDPLFRVGNSRPQRMHNGLALSLLDFLLVTAMILLTPNDEWTNVTRTNPSESVADSGHTFSSDPLRPVLQNPSEATPEIELWRSTVPAQVTGEDRSQCGESSSDSSSSRATSRLSFRTDIQSTAQHSTYPSGQGVFHLRSDSSLSLPAHSRSRTFSQHGHRRNRDLPVPPIPPSFTHNPPSATSVESPVTYLPHGQHPQNMPPSVPPLPTASLPPHDSRLSPLTPISASSRSFATSPTSSIHSRSLPTPPTSKPPLGLLSIISPNSPVTATTASPVSEPAHHPTLSRAHSHLHPRESALYPSSPHHHKPFVKAPPHYAANAPIFPQLPISSHTPVLSDAMSQSLNIQTNVLPDLSAGSATTTSAMTSLTSGDPYDMPPAYSPLDMARSTLPLRTVNGDAGSE